MRDVAMGEHGAALRKQQNMQTMINELEAKQARGESLTPQQLATLEKDRLFTSGEDLNVYNRGRGASGQQREDALIRARREALGLGPRGSRPAPAPEAPAAEAAPAAETAAAGDELFRSRRPPGIGRRPWQPYG
jgi:hypothetical protein